MKKISIVLLAFFFIGITSTSAQTTTEEVKTENTCVKTGKVCDSKCENKAKGTCCNGGEKISCSKEEKESCAKKCSKAGKKECSKKENSCH